ncbi:MULTISPECIES: helix-turn-helix domain-containing protein [unclassified Variovorax]|uniref:winged helix-turn-helix transcriptional regulator n=1 Tax=unclassified Variovorax TaxID=663243 RepID=UPI00257560D6|nr:MULTISPECIES: helix-turn-helix domain-containing protein [unclassified Variovorax]MDM0087203.1 helix-turn-helix domain-containing protein [Variovorax sp. J22G40]MDM0144540.1 helix-turn-helix domain-containing protein [Variovorax sp. J2P1-31]
MGARPGTGARHRGAVPAAKTPTVARRGSAAEPWSHASTRRPSGPSRSGQDPGQRGGQVGSVLGRHVARHEIETVDGAGIDVGFHPHAADEALINARQTRPILEHIANKWSVLILTVLCSKPSRFNEILRRLDVITHKALADALKRLERNGLVRREVLPTKPVGVEYTIPPLGRSLQQPFAALYEWALKHGPELEHAQAAFDHAQDGRSASPPAR